MRLFCCFQNLANNKGTCKVQLDEILDIQLALYEE